MSEDRVRRRTGRLKPIHLALATAVFGLLVMPIALAGAKSPGAKSSARTKVQIKSLQRRVAALESRPSAGAAGPAGGDLAGVYPNPEIAPDAIASPEIADDSIAPDDIVPNSIGQNQIATNGVGQADIAARSVGASQLRSTYERVSPGSRVGANRFVTATASCDRNDQVLGGGFAWQNETNSFETLFSTPNVSGGGFDNPDQWIVRSASSAADNTLFAWAVCLKV